MDPERWQRVKEAFQSSLELPPEERSIYLDGFCAAEPDLRSEIESLLRHHHEAGTLMDKPAGLAAVVGDTEHDPWIGKNVGPYQTVARIGEGGMGAVYRAIRIDDHYLKNVAIKLVRSGLATGHTLRRFKSERQIMASLDHPNIGRLLDGGTTENGLPYLVMEYIDGRPIDEYCDAKHLTTVERLKLFCQVCAAVQYAHQNLIVHRDLKPGNILVTSEGAPKLLDFGIAKLLEPELFFQTAELGGTMVKAMTPEFASPEQVSGDPVTTASDVYSLGVVLYRLLTGHPPYRMDTSNPLDIARAISEVEPERPSAVVERAATITDPDGKARELTPEEISQVRDGRPAQLRRSLAGDVDNIVLKALRKEPTRRYGSAEQLSEDIHRYLDGLPVQARSDTIFYRTGKFVRRNKISVAAVALVILSLVTGIVLTVRQARIAESQRALAERRFDDVRKLSHDLLFDIHDSIQFLPGAIPARKLIVDDALRYLDSLAKESSGDISLQQELAEAYEKVGDVQGYPGRSNLGDSAGATESYRKSLAIRESVARALPKDTPARIGLSQGYLRLGTMLELSGKYQEALDKYNRALEIRRQLAAESPGNRRAQSGLAAVYDAIGGVTVNLSQLEYSLQSRQAESTIFDTLLAADPQNPAYRYNSALGHKKVGAIFHRTGKLDQALQEYRHAASVDEALVKGNPNDTDTLHGLAVDCNDIGDILMQKGDAAGALKQFRRAEEIDLKMVAIDPHDASPRRHLVDDYSRIGGALWNIKDLAGSLAAHNKALALAEPNAASDPHDVELQTDLAEVYYNLARYHAEIADKAATSPAQRKSSLQHAISWYEKSLKVWNGMRASGILSGDNRHKPDLLSDELAKLKVSLTKTGG